VAFAIGTETQGSIVSPTIRNGISALRPTFGRVSRFGGMVLAWTMDKAGPMCRTVEDCAMVFNTIHGADEKDPSTVTAPFRFDRNLNLSRMRIGFDSGSPEPVVAKLRELGAQMVDMPARPSTGSISGLGVESAAAFDMYVSTLPPQYVDSVLAAAGRGRGGGGRTGAAGADTGRGAATAARGRGPTGDNSPGSAASRFARGRSVPALDYRPDRANGAACVVPGAEGNPSYTWNSLPTIQTHFAPRGVGNIFRAGRKWQSRFQ
jgi:hypothetical protein